MITETFRDGYLDGYTWKDNYRPGGPWIVPMPCYPSSPNYDEDMHRHKESVRKKREYLKGFDQGIRARDLVRAMGSTLFMRSFRKTH